MLSQEISNGHEKGYVSRAVLLAYGLWKILHKLVIQGKIESALV